MADTVVSFLVENLLQLVKKNVKLIAGAKEELEGLLRDAETLKAFLDDAARQESNSSSWKDFIRKIKIQVYRAEDVVDKFVVEAKLREEKNRAKKLFYYGGHVKKVRIFAKDIKDIRDKMEDIRKTYSQVFQPKPLLDQPKGVVRKPQDTFLEVKQIVGFDDKAKAVIRLLVKESENLEFVPIVGMTGLGKTTLARKVWSDSQITTEFSKSIWVSIGQSCEPLFFVILKRSREHTEEFHCKDENELTKVIPGFVTEQDRCLIILDDVREKELVDSVRNVLPEKKKGHRILMTTHLRDVASSYASEHPYDLECLTTDAYSFQLLEKRVFDNGGCPNELVELGRSIARKCGGLPLALVVIARALRVRRTVYEWKNIKNNFWQNLVKENEPTSCWKIVTASYGSLSSEMKACFLYCLAFPKGYKIPAQELICLWIAEGLIKSRPRNSFEEIAENYLVEFEKRDLVVASREITAGPIKKVKCNEIFYEFYKMEVTNEGVFQELRLTPNQGLPAIPDPDITRRLNIESSALFDFISGEKNAKSIRSFLCFSSEDNNQTELSSPDDVIQRIVKAFPLIRVLKIESVKIPSSKYLNQLFHLRYISISGDFKELPAFFGKLWNLQSIIIINTSTSERTLNIKADIWNMSKLRQLQTNIPAKLPLPSTQKVKGFSSLQTLSKIAPESCNKVVLEKAGNLKKLSIQGRIEDFFQINKGGFSTFEGFTCLENLKLMSDVPCKSDALQLPKALFGYLKCLKKLTLSNTMFDWKEATRLGQLQRLEILKLKNGAFTGRSWKPEKYDFQELQVLWIQNDHLQYWEASRYHFKKLKKLVLRCPSLESVPVELSQFLQES